MTTTRTFALTCMLPLVAIAPCTGVCAENGGEPEVRPAMRWADTSRRGIGFSKDPSVVRFHDMYWLYFSLPPFGDGRPGDGWNIGIATSRNLTDWEKVGELRPVQACERKGLCAPGAVVIGEQVHLFYQTYGNGPRDAICHAHSTDGITFERNPTNPVFRPSGTWTVGRAIDAEAFVHADRVLLYWATRDPAMKLQMVGVAAAALDSGFGRDTWTPLHDGPILRPELPWEKQCIEAPSVCRRNGRFFMFYAGGYNNEPQQIGVAVSDDGVRWTRLSDEPLLANGPAGAWNASESGHPGIFVDCDGRSYLFYQGNNDGGKSWYLSWVEIEWLDARPRVRESYR